MPFTSMMAEACVALILIAKAQERNKESTTDLTVCARPLRGAAPSTATPPRRHPTRNYNYTCVSSRSMRSSVEDKCQPRATPVQMKAHCGAQRGTSIYRCQYKAMSPHATEPSASAAIPRRCIPDNPARTGRIEPPWRLPRRHPGRCALELEAMRWRALLRLTHFCAQTGSFIGRFRPPFLLW